MRFIILSIYMNSSLLIYEDKPKYDLWIKWLLGGILAFTIIVGLAVINVDIAGTWVCLGAAVFEAILFWAIFPRSYQIYEDKFRIQLGGPFGINISLESITEVNKASTHNAFAYWGMRFATSISNLVEIKRRGGMNVIISPSDAATFMSQLIQARESFSPND
jgi:hypothetical protein